MVECILARHTEFIISRDLLEVLVIHTIHAVHSTAWWSRFEGLWMGPVYALQLGDKSSMITDQDTAGGSASQLS